MKSPMETTYHHHQYPVTLCFRSGDYLRMLTEVGQEQKFEVTYVDIDETTDDGQVQYLVQLSTLPV